MTFLEAAVAVLKEAGRPLNVKKILEIALREDLLSHVGKHPENALADRLAQEAKKAPEQTPIREVRPGVYELREDADLDTARETIRPRAPIEEPPAEADDEADDATDSGDSDDTNDDGPTETGDGDTHTDDDGDEDDASSDDDATSDEGGEGDRSASGGKSRRRRGRRGGRNRNRERSDTDTDTAAVTADESTENAASPDADNDSDDEGDDTGDEATAAEVPASPVAAPARSAAPSRPAKAAPKAADTRAATPKVVRPPSLTDRPAATPDLATEGLGDLAIAVAGFLKEAGTRGMQLRAITTELAKGSVGSLGRVGASVLRAELEHTNELRARLGRPPLFEEIRPNTFTLAVASGSELASSYAALDAWQNDHRRVLRATLLDRVRDLSADALGSVVTLLLDRMGYRDLKSHPPVGDELVTIAALAPRGLTSARTAITVLAPGTRITRSHVIALRGSLHAYHATEGAIVSLAGVDAAATAESDVPNLASITLIGPESLTGHLARFGVGVQSFTVDVSCIDESLFRELTGARVG